MYVSTLVYVKSVCVALQPRKNKLFCPNVTLDNIVLEYISQTKYLGFTFNLIAQDGEDMLRQMRNLYIRSNKLHYVFSVSHGEAAPVRCTLNLVLITLKQLLENLHMGLYKLKVQIRLS